MAGRGGSVMTMRGAARDLPPRGWFGAGRLWARGTCVGEPWCQLGAKGSWPTAYHPGIGVTRKPRQIARLASLGPAELAPTRDS